MFFRSVIITVVLITAACSDGWERPVIPAPDPSGSLPTETLIGVRILFSDATGLFAIDARGTGLVKIADGEFRNLAISPRASHVAFDRGGHVHVRNLLDGSEVVLTPREGRSPSWSPDGRLIAFVDESGSIAMISSAGGEAERVTNPPPYVRDISPSWSPDGAKISFLRHDSEDGYTGLHTIAVDGTGLTLLGGPPAAARAVWSPDGTVIATTDRNQRLLMLVDPASGARKHLAPGVSGLIEVNDWTASSGLFAFVAKSDDGGTSDIHVADANGRSARVTSDASVLSAAFLRAAPSVLPPAVPLQFPPLSRAATIYTETHSFYGFPSRYVFYDDGAVDLQLLTPRFGFIAYEATATGTDSVFTLRFRLDGRWTASATLRGDTLAVQYSGTMSMSDFIDGVYVRKVD